MLDIPFNEKFVKMSRVIKKRTLIFNSHFRFTNFFFCRKDKRKAYFDMQTFAIHYPQNGKGKMKIIEKPALGHYPVALIPGQFTDHYRSYSSNQLKCMPLNTAIKSAPKNPKAFHLAMASAKAAENKRRRQVKSKKASKRRRSDGSSGSSSSGSSSSDSSSESDSSIGLSSSSDSEESDVELPEDKPLEKFVKPVLPIKESAKPTKQIGKN
jgi:hypothetical protein